MGENRQTKIVEKKDRLGTVGLEVIGDCRMLVRMKEKCGKILPCAYIVSGAA